MIPATIWPSLRGLARAPGFALPAVVTLALGIGANTGAFSALRALMWNPLPYPAPDRLVALYETAVDGKPRGVAEGNLLDWRRHAQLLESMAAYQPRSFGLTLRDGGPVNVIQTGMAMAGFFRVVAVPPALGRVFSEEEEVAEAHLLVLTDRLWRQAFSSDRAAISRKVFLNEEPFTVIGVMPAGFEYPMGGVLPDAFLPLSRRDYCCARMGSQEAVARLAPGAGLQAARAELEAAAAAVARDYPATNAGRSAGIRPLAEAIGEPRREPLFLLSAAALALLLIACANVAGLVLARGLGRTREMAIRASLGAGPAGWTAPFLVEAAALGVAGALGGLVAARLLLRMVPAFVPGAALAAPLALDGRAFGFALALAVGVALALGAAPAWLLRRADFAALLKAGGRNSANRGSSRFRNTLVVAQVALGVMLLLGAGVLLRSLLRLATVSPGFETSHALRFGIGLPEKRYDTGRKMIDFHHALLERLAALPGVVSVGAASRLPLRGGAVGPGSSFQIAGSNIPIPQRPRAWINSASPGYFETMRIPLIEGRTFSWRDDQPGRQRVAVVNRTFARTYLQGRERLGTLLDLRFITDLNPLGSQWEIVGVVGDTRQASLDREPIPEIFLSWSQTGADGGVYAIRASGGEAGLARAIAESVAQADPRLERISVKSMEVVVDRNLDSRRAAIRLVGGFGALALLLAALGVYGMVAFRAAERQHEMAIRVALGATAREVRNRVLGHGLRLAAVGAALGLAAFVPASRLLAAQVYGVSATDPFTMAVAAVLAVGAAAAASIAPSIRAARAAPMDLLREG
jgi:putative ABC transport system permease protein